MRYNFETLITEFIAANGISVLDNPNRFKSLFLDFSQNECRAEAQIFSQFLASPQANELKNSEYADEAVLKSIADRFQQATYLEKGICELVVNLYAKVMGLKDKKPVPEKEQQITEAIKCLKCGKELQTEWKSCPYCNTLVKGKSTGSVQRETVIPKPKHFKDKPQTLIEANKVISKLSAAAIGLNKRKFIILSLFTAIAVLGALGIYKILQPSASAFEIKDFVIKDGVITRYLGKGGNVVIPKSVNGQVVKKIGDWVFYENNNLISVSIPEGVTSIGDNTFRACEKIESIIIPDSVNSIGNWTFAECLSLKKIVLPEALISIGEGAFRYTGLTSIYIPASVGSIGINAFEGCKNLGEISLQAISGRFGSGVLGEYKQSGNFFYMELMGDFSLNAVVVHYNGTGSETIVIPSTLNGIPVTEIASGALRGDYTSISIPASVTSIHKISEGSTKLLSIEVAAENPAFSSRDGVLFNKNGDILIEYPSGRIGPYTIPSGVTIISNYAFNNCGELTSINIPTGVTTIGDRAFWQCRKLTAISLPNSVISIGDSAFRWCHGLSAISIPSSVTMIGNQAFTDCRNLTSITVDSNNTSFSSREGVLFNKRGNVLISYPTGREGPYSIPANVTVIEDMAFYRCDALSSITIPMGITSIGEMAFGFCRALTDIQLPKSVKSIGSQAFYVCDGLSSIYIPSGVSSMGYDPFGGCSNLREINVDNKNEYYSSVNGVLFNKQGNVLIRCPEGYEGSFTIPPSVVTIERNAFLSCAKVTSINIPGTVTSIGGGAFSGCERLSTINIPASITSIENDVFSSCKNLNSISIPESVVSIGDYAFRNTGLTAISIPTSVSSMGVWVFVECNDLTSMTVNAIEPPKLGSFWSSDGYGRPEKFYAIYVPASSVNAYKNAEEWKEYAGYIQGISR